MSFLNSDLLFPCVCAYIYLYVFPAERNNSIVTDFPGALEHK